MSSLECEECGFKFPEYIMEKHKKRHKGSKKKSGSAAKGTGAPTDQGVDE